MWMHSSGASVWARYNTVLKIIYGITYCITVTLTYFIFFILCGLIETFVSSSFTIKYSTWLVTLLSCISYFLSIMALRWGRSFPHMVTAQHERKCLICGSVAVSYWTTQQCNTWEWGGYVSAWVEARENTVPVYHRQTRGLSLIGQPSLN